VPPRRLGELARYGMPADAWLIRRPFLLASGDDEPGGDVAQAHLLPAQVEGDGEHRVVGDGGAADRLACPDEPRSCPDIPTALAGPRNCWRSDRSCMPGRRSRRAELITMAPATLMQAAQTAQPKSLMSVNSSGWPQPR
jgi:hypothetical protein